MNKEPWELYPEIWKTKSAFFIYLRGQFRKLWSHYPPKIVWKKAQMIPAPAGFGRAKTVGKCVYCDQLFAASNLEVDHISQAGTCNSWETSQQFLYKLLECNDNWCISCKPCHKIKSYSEKQGISFEDARVEKAVIALIKETDTKDLIAYCNQHGYTDVGNAAKRRKAVTSILKGKYARERQ